MWSDLRHRVRAVFRRKRLEVDLDDELRFHFEHQVEKRLAAGLPRDEAVRRARLSFGALEQVKEECREARGVSALETTLQDLRYAVRVLRKSPAFTAAVVLSLGLGIGANTAIFSLIDAVMLRMLPVERPEELVSLARRQGDATGYGFPYKLYRQFHDGDEGASFTGLAAYSPVRLNVGLDVGAEPTADGLMVSGEYFSVLGVNAAAGRTIGPEDDRIPDAHPVAVISYGYWKRRFARDPTTVGRTIRLCGKPFTIIGVTPPEFFGVEVGAAPDIFVPVMMQPTVMPASENLLTDPILTASWLRIVGRLKPGVTETAVAAGLDVVLQRDLAAMVPKPGAPPEPKPRLVLISTATGVSALRRQFSQSLFILMAVVGVVLLIACANVANLLLARAAARRPEFAMRLALGAGRWRLTRQLLVESLLLAGLGGLTGILFARWAAELLVTLMSSGRSPIVLDLAPDPRMLAFTAAVSLLTGLLFGLAPARAAGRVDLSPALKGRPGGVVGGRLGPGPGKALVVSQVALCLLRLFGAGLFVRSLRKLDSQDAGFDRERVLMVRVEPRGSDQRNIAGVSARLDRIYRDLVERVEAIPGVRSASLAHFSPTSPIGFSSPFRLPSGEQIRVPRLMVYPRYFETMGIPLVAGRDFGPGDLEETSPLVAVVNEAFARQAYPGESALGKQYEARALRGGPALCEIVGVVRDTRYASLRGDPPPVIYQPFFQTNTGRGQMLLHVRTSGAPGAVTPRVREAVQRVDPDLPLFDVRSLATEMDAVLVRERLIATLSGFFSLLALLLACLGLYGLLAYAVVQRTAEMGIRIALGAGRHDVAWMVMREALRLVLLGAAIGVPAALALGRVATGSVSGLLFGLGTGDPTTLLAATLALAAVATLAAYLPARRASRVDPLVALRNE